MTRLIDTDALIEIFDKDKYDRVRNEYQSGYNDGLLHAEVIADNLPTVEAVPVVHGRWIPWKYHDGFRCEKCNEPVYNKHNYCPNCGARMDAERK